jgi:hypothetical protein
MRARNIKPGFFKNDRLAELDLAARVLFQGLWCLADREGRLEDRPKRIKAEILPYDDVDAHDLLEQLAAAGFIARYQVDGAAYIQVVNFLKHQKPHVNEAQSVIPACPSHIPMDMPPTDHGSKDLAPRSQVLGSESLVLNPSCLNEESIESAPDADAPSRSHPRDDIFETMVEVCYGKPWTQLTKTERGRANTAAAELRILDPPPTPGDILARAEVYRKVYPDLPMPPQALTNNWSDLGARAGKSNGVAKAVDLSPIDELARERGTGRYSNAARR